MASGELAGAGASVQRSRNSSGRRQRAPPTGITVRHGAAVAHVGSIGEAALLMQSLTSSKPSHPPTSSSDTLLTSAVLAANKALSLIPKVVDVTLHGRARKSLGTALRVREVREVLRNIRTEAGDELLEELKFIASVADACRHLSTHSVDCTMGTLSIQAAYAIVSDGDESYSTAPPSLPSTPELPTAKAAEEAKVAPSALSNETEDSRAFVPARTSSSIPTAVKGDNKRSGKRIRPLNAKVSEVVDVLVLDNSVAACEQKKLHFVGFGLVRSCAKNRNRLGRLRLSMAPNSEVQSVHTLTDMSNSDVYSVD